MDFRGYLLALSLRQPESMGTLYPFNIPAIKSLINLKFHPRVTYFIGENGMGKSTLLEAIAVYCGFNAEGGSKNFNFKTKDSHSILQDHILLSKGHQLMNDGFFLRSESFYNVASEVDALNDEESGLYESYGGKSLHEQSHGESFWALMNTRFRGKGLYILDEPESALSVVRQMAMLSRIHQLAEDRSQFIIATHSPVILAYPDAIIYEFGEEGIKQVKYRETEMYRTFREFINHPEEMLSILLS